MYLRDLGQLDGPVLLFGGPYSNLPAMRALIDRARYHGIAADHMICTGDTVAYCGQPAETVSEIRKLGCTVVVGNCEKQLAHDQMDCGCGFEEGSSCDLLSAAWYAHADAEIGRDDRDWMRHLPDVVTFSHGGKRCAVIHGGVRDISRFIWKVSPEQVFLEEIKYLQEVTGPIQMVIAGHSGIPFQRRIGDVDWVNAGVIGMPPNRGMPDTCYALMANGRAPVLRLVYDHAATVEDMRQKGLTQGYDTALETGYWPSEDVLPSKLRRSALASG
ncbi:metallophosphoesterase family protein [uncultured Roseovarius sp.]|uniref:metallophosphoesterase family protein n=1 Tax=uncultured Roseovarius sp. TaxID=293344 RepID=UPI0026154C78|nr:metallophosphoesterase family protein [uncultured Roseovarius sp.]